MLDPRKLKFHRLSRGLTQLRLAEICGWKPTHIARMESNRPIDFTLSNVERVAAALDVTVADLLTSGAPSERAGLQISRLRKVHAEPLAELPSDDEALPDDPADDIILPTGAIAHL
jgi:transcriptional regulator with XRE-family HTH domain